MHWPKLAGHSPIRPPQSGGVKRGRACGTVSTYRRRQDGCWRTCQASVAQFETEVPAKRVQAGRAAARAAGETWGGSKKGRRLKVKPEQVDVVRRMQSKGAKIAAIARAVSLSRPTVYAILAERPQPMALAGE